MKTEPNDIDMKSVEHSIRMYEQDAVDRECGGTRRWTTLEICLGAVISLETVTILAFALCEIIRLIRTYGI
jgi:hypothetical protein